MQETLLTFPLCMKRLIKRIIIIIIMVIFKCYFSREHIENGVDIELGKTDRLKALCMMENHTLNKQTMCQQTKTKHGDKKHLHKSVEKKRSILHTNSIR